MLEIDEKRNAVPMTAEVNEIFITVCEIFGQESMCFFACTTSSSGVSLGTERSSCFSGTTTEEVRAMLLLAILSSQKGFIKRKEVIAELGLSSNLELSASATEA